MPTGETTAGIPKAMYCKALKAHFPLAQRSSSRGINPILKRSRSSISVSFFHGRMRSGPANYYFIGVLVFYPIVQIYRVYSSWIDNRVRVEFPGIIAQVT